MTSGFAIAVEVEGFEPLDPRDPENLDRKHDERDPKVVERQRQEHRKEAEKQRKDLLATLENVAKKGGGHVDVKLVDQVIRDDGTAIIYFEFDPAVEGDHFTRQRQVRVDSKGKETDERDPQGRELGRRAVVEEVNPDTQGDGATTWDSALRNEVEQARSVCVGGGLQVNEVRVEALPEGKEKGAGKSKRKTGKRTATSKETKVSEQNEGQGQGPQSPSTHQESQDRSVEPSPEEVREAQREEGPQADRDRAKEAEKVAKRSEKDSKRKS